MTQEFKHIVESAKEYKHAVKHAEALGFHVHKTYCGGNWNAENCPAWPKQCDIQSVGRKYFKIPLYDGEYEETRVFDCEPIESFTGNHGYVEITFRKD